MDRPIWAAIAWPSDMFWPQVPVGMFMPSRLPWAVLSVAYDSIRSVNADVPQVFQATAGLALQHASLRRYL